jgi:hypothetical protein
VTIFSEHLFSAVEQLPNAHIATLRHN